MKERNSSIELLRILAMIGIVLNHLAGHGGSIEYSVGINKALSYLYQINGKLGVAIFVLIGSKFLVHKPASKSSVLRLWIKVFCCCFVVGIIRIFVFHDISDGIHMLLPITFNVYWFFTCYIFLLVLTPYLTKFVNCLNKKEYTKFIVIMAVLNLCIPLLSSLKIYFFNEFIWFIFLYFFAGYYELYLKEVVRKYNRIYYLLLFGITYMGMFFIYFITKIKYFRNSGSLLLFVSAIGLLFFFDSFDFQSIPINRVAKVTFMVYLIHDCPLREYLWMNIFRCNEWYDSKFFLAYSLLIVATIFAVAFLVEFIYDKTIGIFVHKLINMQFDMNFNIEKIKYSLSQVVIIIFLLTSFLFSAAIWQMKKGLHNAQTLVILFTIVLLMCSIAYVWCNKNKFKIHIERFELIILAIVILPRMIQLRDLQPNDAGVYYFYLQDACKMFDFTWDSIHNFMLAGHPTLGYALFCAAGKYLYPERLIGINAVKLILVCFSAVYLYRIFLYLFKNASKVRCMIYTMLVMNIPIFLGLFSYFTPELFTSIYLIYVIYFFLTKKYILFSFWTLMLIETKENAILLVGAIYGIFFITKVIEALKITDDKTKRNKIIAFIVGIGILICTACILFVLSWKWGGGLSSFKLDGSRNNFGINVEHIIIKMKQLTVHNYTWLLWGICLILTVKCIWNLKAVKHSSLNCPALLTAMWYGVLVQVAFQLLYNTYEMPRYDNVIIISLSILTCIMLEIFITNNMVKTVIASLLAVIMFIQAFISFDPIMSLCWKEKETGGISMYEVSGLGKDDRIYNYQYSYLGRVFEKMLIETSYYGQDVFMIGGEKLPYNYDNGYWNMQTNTLQEEPSLATVPLNLHTEKQIMERKKLVDSISELRQTDSLIVLVPYNKYNDEKIRNELYKIYETVEEGQEISDGIYGKMYYIQAYNYR